MQKVMFQDTMDTTRVIQPIEQNGKSMLCGIYWKTKNGLTYGGKANVPAALIGDPRDHLIQRIGFIPLSSGSVE